MQASKVGNDVTGIVLAGGAARRMNGLDKGLVKLNGKRLIEHVLQRMSEQCTELIISANRHLDTYATFGYPVVADQMQGYPGPLAGIAAAMPHSTQPFCVVAPCDSPFVPMDYVCRLRAAFNAHPAASCAAVTAQGLKQPVFLMLKTDQVQDLHTYMAQGGRKVRAYLESRNAIWVPFEDLCAFDNFNTAQDIENAENRCSS